jgi:hypothetical protein
MEVRLTLHGRGLGRALGLNVGDSSKDRRVSEGCLFWDRATCGKVGSYCGVPTPL